jgi:hypothetical protein
MTPTGFMEQHDSSPLSRGSLAKIVLVVVPRPRLLNFAAKSGL